MSSVPNASTTSKASSSNNPNPSNTTVNKGIKPRPSIIDFKYEPNSKSIPGTPPNDPYSTPIKSMKERSFTPIKSGSKDTTAIPSSTPSNHLRNRSSSFSSPSLKPEIPSSINAFDAIPFNLDLDLLTGNLKASKTTHPSRASKRAFSRTKQTEVKAESSKPAITSKRSSRLLKREDSTTPHLTTSTSFRLPALKEEKPVKSKSLERLKTKGSLLLETFFSADKEEVRKMLIGMRCSALNLQKKYVEKLDNKRKSIGLSTFETDDLAFDDTKSIVHLKIAEFFDEVLVKLSKDIKKDKDKLQKWLPIDLWEKPRSLAVAKSYLQSILEFKKLVKSGLDRKLSEEMLSNANSPDLFTIENIAKNNFIAFFNVMKEAMNEIHMDPSECVREVLIRYKEVLDNLNIYIDDLKSMIDQLARKEHSFQEPIELKKDNKRTSVRKSRVGSFAPSARQSLVLGESKTNSLNFDAKNLAVLNKMIEEIEKFEKETSKKNKSGIILQILDQLNTLILTTETDLFPGLPKRSASEFGYMDIQHLLIEKEIPYV